MTFASVDEARRYVEMKRAGARTSFDDTPAIDLIESVLDEYDAARCEVSYTEEEYDTAIQAEHEATESSVREDLLGTPEALAAEVSLAFLMRALEARIDLDQNEAIERAVTRVREGYTRAAEIEANRKAQRKEAAADRKRKRLADGGGS